MPEKHYDFPVTYRCGPGSEPGDGIARAVADDAQAVIDQLRAQLDRLKVGPPPAPLQLISDCGLNPFACVLLAESFEKHPNPKQVTFRCRDTMISLWPAKPADPLAADKGTR